MAVTVKRASLWRRELENRPGTLAEALKPFADEKENLQIVMGYVAPGGNGHAAVEVYPVVGEKAEKAAKAAGLSQATDIHSVIVEGDDRPGLAYEMAHAFGQSNVNINFSVFQVIDKKFVGVFGFPTEESAKKAEELIKKAYDLVKA